APVVQSVRRSVPHQLFSRGAKWKVASLVLVFLISAIATSILSDGYLTVFFKIAQCPATAPSPNVTLVRCRDVGTDFYYSGALYLDVNKELVASLRAANVAIIGNSRTRHTFATPPIEQYFQQKGLRYFVLSSDGSGFRYIQLILERLGVRPTIF